MRGTACESKSCQCRIIRQGLPYFGSLLYLIQVCNTKSIQTPYHCRTITVAFGTAHERYGVCTGPYVSCAHILTAWILRRNCLQVRTSVDLGPRMRYNDYSNSISFDVYKIGTFNFLILVLLLSTFHRRFSIYIASRCWSMHHHRPNADLIIINTLSEKKTKKFRWRKHISRWISHPRKSTELRRLWYIRDIRRKHRPSVLVCGGKYGRTQGIIVRARACDSYSWERKKTLTVAWHFCAGKSNTCRGVNWIVNSFEKQTFWEQKEWLIVYDIFELPKASCLKGDQIQNLRRESLIANQIKLIFVWMFFCTSVCSEKEALGNLNIATLRQFSKVPPSLCGTSMIYWINNRLMFD